MTLNEFVDKVYYINLDRRPDRRRRCEEIFASHGLVVERFSAIDGRDLEIGKLPPGIVGVTRSTLAILREAKERGYRSVAIFEDDVELDDDFGNKFSEYICQVPDDWSLIYLGGNNKRPTRLVTKNVARLVQMYGAYAFIIRNTVYDKIINKLEGETRHNDFHYAIMQQRHPSYAFKPYLAWVRNDYSDINNSTIDVSNLKKDRYEE